jgi:hypothetical protein
VSPDCARWQVSWLELQGEAQFSDTADLRQLYNKYNNKRVTSGSTFSEIQQANGANANAIADGIANAVVIANTIAFANAIAIANAKANVIANAITDAIANASAACNWCWCLLIHLYLATQSHCVHLCALFVTGALSGVFKFC